MKQLFAFVCISKQAMWKQDRRLKEEALVAQKVIGIINEVRKNHKRMGCRRIYYSKLNTTTIGRDRFEEIGFAYGFKLKRKRSVIKTTWGQRIEVFPNLIEGKTLNNINQVWQSDIFYIKVEGIDYYVVSIQDIYSRKILALHVSRSLAAIQIVFATKAAFKIRRGTQIRNCKFHTDRGSQYISNKQKALIRKNGMLLSMCKMPQENAYVERIQGTIKEEYLNELDLTVNNIKRIIRNIIRWYNTERPHSSLDMMTPDQFEEHIKMLAKSKRPLMKIYQGFSDPLVSKRPSKSKILI